MRIKLSEYAKNNGISYMTAYRYFNKGMLKGVRFDTGTILIDIDQENKTECINNNAVLYSRVSSSENKKNAEAQLNRLRNYASAKGYKITREIIEIGSGLNDKRPKLSSILEKKDWGVLIVEHKDRFSRFGLNFINILLQQTNRKIEIINDQNDDKDELMEDFISIVTSFCARLYGLRRSKRKTEKIIESLAQ